jgi:5-hydroxyisourate hydrolase
MGQLTTHVLDLTHGKPANGMVLRLFDPEGQLVVEVSTNEDGRCDKPIIEGEKMKEGRYRIEFEVSDYFSSQGVDLPETPFLDIVTINFGITSDTEKYHVPLLVSPYGYSTYRGS